MRLSTRARYALRMMLDIARNGGQDVPVSLGMVAERTDLSRGYLEQVALSLRNARLVKGVAVIITDLCEECGICAEVCPIDAVRFELPHRGFDAEHDGYHAYPR